MPDIDGRGVRVSAEEVRGDRLKDRGTARELAVDGLIIEVAACGSECFVIARFARGAHAVVSCTVRHNAGRRAGDAQL
jgi:hypothetical protein